MRKMTLSKSILWRAFILLALLSAISTARGSRPETTTKIDVPGAVVTVASGINGDGTIVGWYCLQPCSTPARFHGFMLKDDVWTYIDVPNSSDHPAIGTQPRYISPQGIVIGAYLTLEDGATLANPRFRGFAWFEGTFTYLDAPDWIYDNPSYPHSIIPRAINANGDLVGCIHDKNQGDSMHAFLLSGGAFTKDPAGMTMNNGVNAEGEIVGLDNSSTTAYHINKFGIVERFSFPDTDATNAWDINSKGEIVGQAFTNGGTVSHAFLRSWAQVDGILPAHSLDYRFIDPTGALSSTAFGISSNGNVVGQYRDSFSNCSVNACVHGFLLQRGDD